jgi:hypothetical protein
MKINKFKWPHNGIAFGDIDEESEFMPVMGHGSTCCSLFTLTLKNYHTYDGIKSAIDYIKKDSNSRVFSPKDRSFGERNLQVICSPGEQELEINLKKLGFSCLSDKMTRRKGYPAPNKLKLYMLSF